MRMANRIGFREFVKKTRQDEQLQLILDANVIIASRDINHKDHKKVKGFFKSLEKITNSFTLFTSVTTKAEFLEYYRRKILTEGILDLYKRNNEKQILSNKVKKLKIK